MHARGLAILLAAALACGVRPAWADATAFIGANTTPANRQTRGFALGVGLLIFGVEGEYAATSDDPAAGAPSLKMGSGSVLLQTPGEIFGVQPYFITGVGLFHESLAAHSETGVVLDTGGGVKIGLVGPIRVRVDYRVLRLGSGALYSPAHRVYAGLNVKF